jgi:hypothetical protein
LREALPVVFRPTDISGLQIWMDSDDPSTITTTPFGLVEKWANKGDLSGNFDLSGATGISGVLYGFFNVNGLEVVTFNPQGYMVGNFALNFQDRSVFIVSRRRTDISGGVFTWLTSDTADGMETGISQSGANFTYLVATHPGFSVELGFTTTTDTTGYAELATFVNSSTDLSGNYAGLNSVEQTLIVSNLAAYETASIPYYLGNYFGGSALGNDYDLCEVIIYKGALDSTQIAQVEEYLISKWAITPPPPKPFAPDDIAGLQVWLDASNAGSLTLSGSDVSSWSNLGSVSASFTPGSNVAISSSNVVGFSAGTSLDSYFQLPYTSRTTFSVIEIKDDLTTSGYPYVNIMNANATDGRQVGVSYDAGNSNFVYTICQAGTNCPIVAPTTPLPTGLFLIYSVIDAANQSNSAGYWGNSSNLNTSPDVGNLFNQNPIPYSIGSPVFNSPAFNLAEFLEYDSILSAGDIASVKSYLSDKWGLGL